MSKAVFIKFSEVPDPATNSFVDVAIFKHENGRMFGLDPKFLNEKIKDNGVISVIDPFSDLVNNEVLFLIGY